MNNGTKKCAYCHKKSSNKCLSDCFSIKISPILNKCDRCTNNFCNCVTSKTCTYCRNTYCQFCVTIGTTFREINSTNLICNTCYNLDKDIDIGINILNKSKSDSNLSYYGFWDNSEEPYTFFTLKNHKETCDKWTCEYIGCYGRQKKGNIFKIKEYK